MRDWQWLHLSVEAMTVFTEINPAFLLPDDVWERVKTAIPPNPPKPKGGRPRMDNRKALNAIFYLLRLGASGRHCLVV